ncbi:tetratricopeptide repeat protein [Actinocorallia sp. API 0066]|uniref:tetratricopeptide repeat protein n=1 Tax=Actinocorallia sp. API 0066 TaxID=2896846 RepID=UPI001E3834BA|nr:tetratricopeptide repeat protein [Actinocorallia sp. API 0066]MCD0451373.1 tetratricopeptide repeat protein [Actinocorallia sp. API 0066]
MQKRDFSLHGAVDLGARAAAAKRQQERAERPAGAGGQYVFDVTDATFGSDVVERSMRVPVMVAFIVDKEPSCDALVGDLEKLVAEGAGSWLLARVDIEVNQQLQGYLQQMRVQRLPFVGVVVQGQMMPFLNSVPPEAELRAAVGELFAALKEQGLMGDLPPEEAEGGQPPLDPAHAAAEEALGRGDFEIAAEAFREVLAADPRDEVAKRRLALTELTIRVKGYDQERVGTDPLAAADVQLLQGDVEGAFDRLIAQVRATSGDDRNAVRLHLLLLFETLPADDPRVAKARRALQAALF